MRLDKYLKVSRLIKRRTVANDACDAGRVMINGKVAKASVDVKAGDIIEISFGNKNVKVRVKTERTQVRKKKPKGWFERALTTFSNPPDRPLTPIPAFACKKKL